MNPGENQGYPQGIHNYRGEFTFRYKKYRPPIPVGFSGISDGLVASIQRLFVLIRAYPNIPVVGRALPAIPEIAF
jgi:hypothetical protein